MSRKVKNSSLPKKKAKHKRVNWSLLSQKLSKLAKKRNGKHKNSKNSKNKISPTPTKTTTNKKPQLSHLKLASRLTLTSAPKPKNQKATAARKRQGQQPATKPPIKRKPKSWSASIVIALHVLIILVGTSTILGTTIAIANSFNSPLDESNTATQAAVKVQSRDNKKLERLFPIASLGKKIPELTSNIENLIAQYPDIEPQIFLIDLDTKGFVNLKGNAPIASASTIKLPILVALFQDVDAGKVRLTENLTITKELIAGGSGNMQYEKPGTQYTVLETATKMMTISDNTATNMLIERLGGMDKLNERFLDWGLTATRLRNPLPDLTGTNTTSAEDLGNLLAQIERGEMVSWRSRDRLLHIMHNIVRNTLLPEGLESDALIAHKTGDIKSVLGDAGLVDMPSGKRYIISVLVKRPDNDPQAKEFIQKMSKVAYQYFKGQETSY